MPISDALAVEGADARGAGAVERAGVPMRGAYVSIGREMQTVRR